MKSTRQAIFRKLETLYGRMQDEYAAASAALGLSCAGCEKNCCVSHFQHHTYVEWAFLWKGMNELPAARREEYLRRAEDCVRESRALLAQGIVPAVMCPLNDDGLCGLYAHRLMICRMHGVPNVLVRPDGRGLEFPGCHRAQALAAEGASASAMNRTPIYRELAALEGAFQGNRRGKLPKVDLTLAEMLVSGPPRLVP